VRVASESQSIDGLWTNTRMFLTRQSEKSLDRACMPRNPGYLRQLSPLLISAGKQCS